MPRFGQQVFLRAAVLLMFSVKRVKDHLNY